MKITLSLLDTLTQAAKESPRLRMNYDLRTSPADGSQRMLNALEPGTAIPIHRHTKSTEVVVMLRGRGIQYYYDDAGNVTGSTLLESPLAGNGSVREALSEGSCQLMSVELGQWHRLEALESGTVIFESKDGPYEPLGPEDVMEA